MWPLPTLDNDLICIAFSPNNLVCSWIQKSTISSAPFTLHAYERHELHLLELENLVLYNPTYIGQLINQFLTQHNKYNAFVTLCLSGGALSEDYVALPTSTPKVSDFGMPHSSNILWGYRYMYQNHEGQSIFYVYKMPRSILLQYQLLATQLQLNLLTITTEKMALFNAYKAIFGNVFRQSQLAIDMIQHNNFIEKTIAPESLKRMIVIPPTLQNQQECTHIATAYGLFTMQGLSL